MEQEKFDERVNERDGEKSNFVKNLFVKLTAKFIFFGRFRGGGLVPKRAKNVKVKKQNNHSSVWAEGRQKILVVLVIPPLPFVDNVIN